MAARLLSAVALLLSCAASFAPANAAPSDASLSDQQLQKLDAAALGKLYAPADQARYRAAHDLIEQYFDEPDAEKRRIFARQLTAAALSPAVVGRLVRIRLGWRDLAPGVYFINKRVGPHDVRYFLGIPAGYDLTHPWPLVVKLPVANAFLTNPPPDADQVAHIYAQWMSDELTAHRDAVVVMPLLNLDQLYGPGPVGMSFVMQPIFDAANQANIDPARVYLIGHSMAAHAVWNLALHEPTYFAGFIALAGEAHETWQRIRLGNLRNVLPIVWADRSDKVVNYDESRSLVRFLRALKDPVDYDETANLGHVPSPQILQADYRRLLSTTRPLYPRSVYIESNRPNTEFNRVDWLQIYQPLSTGDVNHYALTHGGERMRLYQKDFRAIASLLPDNSISMQTANVQTLRVYLNDQMVDFSKPIRITVNGRERFNAIVPQSMDEMLKDQVFLRRGWRYFTGIVDLDLTQAMPQSRPAGDSAPPAPASHGVIEYTAPDGSRQIYIPH